MLIAERLRGGKVMTELKPCPFCGRVPHLDIEEIFCDCGAKMPIPIYAYGWVRQGKLPSYTEAKAEMIEAWNRRANDDRERT